MDSSPMPSTAIFSEVDEEPQGSSGFREGSKLFCLIDRDGFCSSASSAEMLNNV